MTRLNAAITTFGILVLLSGARVQADEIDVNIDLWDEIDYVRDVAPILIEQCQMCHREGGIAPWAMSNYQVVQAFAPAIKEAIVSRRMPPGQINPKYRDTIINHRTLSDDEMKTLVDWICIFCFPSENYPCGKFSCWVCFLI